jgi:hypothetical protein
LTAQFAGSKSGDESYAEDDAVEEAGLHAKSGSAILEDAINGLGVLVRGCQDLGVHDCGGRLCEFERRMVVGIEQEGIKVVLSKQERRETSETSETGGGWEL